MVESQRLPVPAADVICRQTEDGAVLVSPEAGELRVLNAAGAAIWQLLDGRRSVAELADELARRYQLPAEQAQADLDNFLSDLEGRGLLSWANAASRRATG